MCEDEEDHSNDTKADIPMRESTTGVVSMMSADCASLLGGPFVGAYYCAKCDQWYAYPNAKPHCLVYHSDGHCHYGETKVYPPMKMVEGGVGTTVTDHEQFHCDRCDTKVMVQVNRDVPAETNLKIFCDKCMSGIAMARTFIEPDEMNEVMDEVGDELNEEDDDVPKGTPIPMDEIEISAKKKVIISNIQPDIADMPEEAQAIEDIVEEHDREVEKKESVGDMIRREIREEVVENLLKDPPEPDPDAPVGTTISTAAEKAGVTCPKEVGKIDKDASCKECPNYSKCIGAVSNVIGYDMTLLD